MPSSSIITILSLVVLCTLSFSVVFGSPNILDTLARDTLAHDSPLPVPRSNVVHKHRALHHARATTPVPASGSNSPQSNPTPSQSAPSTPDANTQASSAAPSSSPSPSSQPSTTQDNSSSAPSPSRATSTSPGTSAASSASASPSSTPSPTSSSSIAQASSSPGVTSSSVRATSNVFTNPTTTFVNHPVSFSSGAGSGPTIAGGSTVSAGATPGTGASSRGFFNNKAAVGATFSIVGIVGGLAVIMAVLTIMKRRRRARSYAIGDEEFFEKYPSVDHNEPVPHLPPGFGSGSAEPSFTDFNMSAAPTDAYPDRAVHYGQSNAGAVLNPVDYGIAYPPGVATNNNPTPATRNGEDTASEYSVPSASHPFADPANTSGPTAAPPVTYPRQIAGRAQEMVTTDSYYGPNSAGLGAGGMGYAQ